jgi:hypothetical protein
MKKFAIDYKQNEHLLDAIRQHMDDLGFGEVPSIDNNRVNPAFPYACTVYGDEWHTYDQPREREIISLDRFFSLTKEDVNPEPPAKEMTVEQAAKAFGNHKLEELLQDALGYKIKIVEKA